MYGIVLSSAWNALHLNYSSLYHNYVLSIRLAINTSVNVMTFRQRKTHHKFILLSLKYNGVKIE